MKTKQTQTKKAKQSLHTRVRRHAKTVLVPHKDNQYRPHLIRAQGLVAVLVIALVAQLAYSFITTGRASVLGRESDIQVSELFIETNKARKAANEPELKMNDNLSHAAFLKAQNMISEQYWAHVSPSGIQPWKWFADAGYNYSYAGENLAKNYPSAGATVEAWMGSPTHRENILNKAFVDVGFAVVTGELQGEETTLVVAMYGAPVTVAATQAAAADHKGFLMSSVEDTVQQPLQYFSASFDSLSPVTIAILGLLAIVALVGVIAHHYRNKLPKSVQKSWRKHHGMYTFIGMLILGALIIVATGGGQI